MHELSVTESLLEIALRHARQAGAGRVTDLYVVIGAWSSIVDDSVQFYWDMVAKDTPAEGARLHFERILAQAVCQDCSREYAPSDEDLACPACGGSRIKLMRGDEFYLDSIAVESTPAQAAGGGPG